MKNCLSKVLCVVLCLALVFALSACGDSGGQKDKLDLGEDDTWDVDDNGGSENGGTTETNDDVNDNGNAEQNAKDAVADADSLSWSQLVSKMPANLRNTTFTVFSWNPVTDVTDADKVVENFTKQTSIKVNWVQNSYEEYDSKLTALVNAKKAPDLIRFIAPEPSRMYNCQDLKSATGYDFKGDIWDSRVTSSYSYKGKFYAANLKNTLNQQPSVIMYRPSMINRYKLDDPYTLWKQGKWTYDVFANICREFKAEVGHGAWMTSAVIDYLWYTDVDLITFDGTYYKNNLSDKNVILALQEVISNRDDLCPEAAGETDKFEDGTYLFYSTNIIAARTTDFHITELKANDDVECVPFPTIAGKTYYTNFQEFEAYGVPKGASNGPAAYYFMRYYLDANNYNENTFFCSPQVLETYKYLMSQKNYNFNVDRRITAVAGNSLGDINKMIRTGEMTSAQVKTKLDSVSPFFDKAVKQANETLDKFK